MREFGTKWLTVFGAIGWFCLSAGWRFLVLPDVGIDEGFLRSTAVKFFHRHFSLLQPKSRLVLMARLVASTAM